MTRQQLFDLTGKTALITGSSDGIGKAIALTLAAHGAAVIIHGKDNQRECEEVVNDIKGRGGEASWLLGDIGNEAGIEQVVSGANNVDILVNNASVQIRKAFEDIGRADFDEQINANVWSSIRLINRCLPTMAARKWGRIVMLGSVQQTKPHPEMTVYAATKAALGNMVVNLAGRYAGQGITVNAIAPGVIETSRNVEALADQKYADIVRKKIPAGYFGRPDDCSGLALLLCSDAGRYITGQSIYCDGGMSL